MSDWHPPQEQQPQYGASPSHPYAANTDKRPGTVTAAVVVTWVGCGLAAIGCLVVLALAFSGSEGFMDGVVRDGDGTFTRSQARGILVGVGVVGFVWSVIASVLALLTLKRQGWARVVLAVSAVMAALVSLVMILSMVSAITLILAISALVLLFVGGANDWFAHRSAVQQHGAAAQYYA